MNIKLVADIVGSLFPVIFPKQEFKPKRLAGLVVCAVLVLGSVKLLGVEGTEQAIDLMEDVMEIAEE